MFLVDDVPYLIDKAEQSTLYRFPELDPAATVTLEKVGVLAGQVANLSGADLSSRPRPPGRRHPHHPVRLPGQRTRPWTARRLVADLISRPPAWTVQLAGSRATG